MSPQYLFIYEILLLVIDRDQDLEEDEIEDAAWEFYDENKQISNGPQLRAWVPPTSQSVQQAVELRGRQLQVLQHSRVNSLVDSVSGTTSLLSTLLLWLDCTLRQLRKTDTEQRNADKLTQSKETQTNRHRHRAKEQRETLRNTDTETLGGTYTGRQRR